MENIKQQIEQNIEEVDAVVEMFYQQKTQEAYVQLDQVLGKMMAVIELLAVYQQEHTDAEIDITGLTEALKEALSAMEEKDAILMADVLKYEVIEKLEALIETLS